MGAGDVRRTGSVIAIEDIYHSAGIAGHADIEDRFVESVSGVEKRQGDVVSRRRDLIEGGRWVGAIAWQ